MPTRSLLVNNHSHTHKPTPRCRKELTEVPAHIDAPLLYCSINSLILLHYSHLPMEYPGHDTPNFKIVARSDFNGCIIRVFRFQKYFPVLNNLQPFEGKFLAYSRDYNSVVCCCDCAVNHNNIVVINTRSGHRVAAYPHEIAAHWVRHNQIVDIKISLFIVARGRRKTGMNGARQKAHVAKNRIVHKTPSLIRQHSLNMRTEVR